MIHPVLRGDCSSLRSATSTCPMHSMPDSHLLTCLTGTAAVRPSRINPPVDDHMICGKLTWDLRSGLFVSIRME